MRKLRSLDLDKDGRISSAELECAVEQLVMEERKHQNFKIATCAVVALLVFVLLANMGLAYGAALSARTDERPTGETAGLNPPPPLLMFRSCVSSI